MKKFIKGLLNFGNYFFIGFSFLASKKIVAVLELVLFMCFIQVSTGHEEVMRKQEQGMFSENRDLEIQYYHNSSNSMDSYQTGMEQLVQCYQRNLDISSLDESIRNYIDKLQQLYNRDDRYNKSSKYFSFLYQDLYSGFTVSYNENAPIFTASTIKAPAMIYLYEQVGEGKVDLEEKLTYTSNFYHGGSGVLQTKPVNTEYSVGELIYYAIHDSDNIAYAMLMNRFGRENILNYWSHLGTKNIYTLNTIWGVTSAKDASIYMNELYKFSRENKEYGQKLMEYFQGATWKLITNKEGLFNTANKGGWSEETIHDVAIVFEKNPYLLVIMSKTGNSDYPYLFAETSRLVGELHEAYWQFKESLCKDIKQHYNILKMIDESGISY